MAVAELEVRIRGNAADLTGTFNKASAQAKSFGATMSGLGKSMSTVGRTMTLGVTLPIVAGFKKALDAAGEAQRAMAQTSAVIKSTGGAAGVTAGQVVKMADAFSQTTLFTDDAIQSAENLLLTFTKIGSQTFPRATQSILDMSQAMGQDLQSTVVQVGKALNDPIKGITALSRVGVTFSQSQKDLIKNLVESGKVMEAQAVILEELEKEFGGAAAAAASTEWGQGQQAIKRLGEVLEELGQTIAPIAADVFENLADKAEALAKWFGNLSPTSKKIVTNLVAMAAAAGPLLFIFGKLSSAIGAIAALSGFSRVAGGVAGIGGAAAGATPAILSLSGALGVVQAALAGLVIGTAIQQGIIQPMLDAKWAAEDLRLEWEANIATFDAIATRSKPVAESLDLIQNTFANLKPTLEGNAEAMERVFSAETASVIRDAAEAGAQVNTVIRAIAGGMSSAAAEAALASGAFQGTSTSLGSVADKAGNVATLISDAAGNTRLFIETAKGVKEVAFDDAAASAESLASALGLPIDQARELASLINGLPTFKTFTYKIETVYSDSGVAPIGDGVSGAVQGLTPRAAGGPVNAMSAYVVGERGPELFVPRISGTIVPNGGGGAADFGGGGAADFGGGIVINIDGRREDAEELAERIQRVLIQKSRRSGRILEIA